MFEREAMTIEIRDASLEARLQKQLQATGSSSVEEALLRLLEPCSHRVDQHDIIAPWLTT
jgi:hypothetical protein